MDTVPGARSYGDATEKLRSAAKWLIATAAGVGGVLVTGLQLGSLGKLSLTQWPRLTIAVGGLILALGGVAVVIVRAAELLTEDWVTLGELSVDDFQRRLERRRGKPKPGDVDVIYADVTAYSEELYGRVATTPEDLYRLLRDANQRARERSSKRRDQEIRAAVNAVVEFANYRRTRADFDLLRRGLMLGAGLVTVGAVMFAIAAHTSDPPADKGTTEPFVSRMK